ncbi:MAG: hypothetical protein QNL04_08775 [SAR324 cluster bacterium]|nr:hypothetical protein [SAR324 cluster bacterium]
MNRKSIRLRAPKQQSGLSLLTLLIAVGLVFSFVGCSFMFGKMMVSGGSDMTALPMNQNHMQMGHSAHMSHSANLLATDHPASTPKTDECCDTPMAGQTLITQSDAPKVVFPSILLFVLLSSLTYFSILAKKSNLELSQTPPPPPRSSLLAQKTLLLQ